jgi:TfoX/Sxy family transcriptional regulator of competence genes
MPYDEYLQERIERNLSERGIAYETKKMMGGICFMIDDKMCLGIVKNDLMTRVGEHRYDDLLKREGARPMDFAKRPMKGYLFVSPQGVDREEDLSFWIEQCLAFNPFAKSSKKK